MYAGFVTADPVGLVSELYCHIVLAVDVVVVVVTALPLFTVE